MRGIPAVLQSFRRILAISMLRTMVSLYCARPYAEELESCKCSFSIFKKCIAIPIMEKLSRRFIDNIHLEFLIQKFVSCLKRFDEPFYMPDHMLNIPFFYFLFSKPSKTMIGALSKIRKSVNLPPLERELGDFQS